MPTRITELPEFSGDLTAIAGFLLLHNDSAAVGQKSQRLPLTILAALQGRSDYASEEITIPDNQLVPIPATTNSFIRYSIAQNSFLSLPSLPNNSAKEMYLWCFNDTYSITLYDTDQSTVVGEFAGNTSNGGLYCQFLVNEWVVTTLAKPGVA